MTSEIDKLKHFHVENYSGTNFTDDLNDGEEFLYTTIRCKDDKEVTFLCKYVKNKHIEVCPNCIFNNYLCYGLLCNIVVLKVVKDEEMRRRFYGLITVLELLKIQKLLYLKMVDLLVILV